MKTAVILIGIMLIFGNITADSILSFPVEQEVPKETKNLLLTITIPSKLPEEPEEEMKEPDFYYFNFNPFPKSSISAEQRSWLSSMGRRGFITGHCQSLVEQNALNSRYNVAMVLENLINNLSKVKKDTLIDRKVTQEDVNIVAKFVDEYHKEFRSMHKDFAAIDKTLVRIKRGLRAEKGEVKVLKVETDDNGSTMIHLRLNEEEKHIRLD